MGWARRISLDTNAIIYLFNQVEPYWHSVEQLVESVRTGERALVLSAVTELELLVRTIRAHDFEDQARVNALFGGMANVTVLELTRPIVRIAAQIRAMQRLSVSDAAIVATALYAGCDAIIGNDARCAERVQDIPYLLLDDLVEEATP